jgi:hypothetical protein
MDNVFRTKKYKDTSKTQSNELGGTLDSIHNSVISKMLKIDHSDLKEQMKTIQSEIENIDNIVRLTKLKEEYEKLKKLLSKRKKIMAENKFKYFTVTTTSIVKASNMSEAEKIASGSRRTVSGVAGELLFKDVDVERITAVKAREQIES